MKLGAHYIGNGKCEFSVWAPLLKEVALLLVTPEERVIPMERDGKGYWKSMADSVFPGTRYFYRLGNKRDLPDPASRFQPEGVHGPSQVIDPSDFSWNDESWGGLRLRDFIIYELHVGTFSKEGTFESIIPYLNYLKELGITAIELMPLAQFPGGRNWGYDGVHPFAPQNSYGGPQGLKILINECHKRGLAVILDVVYNHLGPEGNYLGNFGPYFTDKYKTPWGDAINFDGPYSDEVRAFFISNALHWITEYHVDALRVDAIHGIFDFSAKHFLQELAGTVRKQAESSGKNLYIVAESDLNDVRFINPPDIGGCGLDAQWNDDFHHSLHALITGENNGYYQDFGGLEHLVKAFKEGFVYTGQYSKYRNRSHGNSTAERPARQFIVSSQNHDQVGNRMAGDRLAQTQSLEKLKLAAGAVILSPYLPLLFMGEEYGEKAPFLYFVSFSDRILVKAVRKGRLEEFAAFRWKGKPPDPQAERTFLSSRIDIGLRQHEDHKILFNFYKKLIELRKKMPAFSNLLKENMEVKGLEGKVLFVRRWFAEEDVICLYNFDKNRRGLVIGFPEGIWTKVLDSSSEDWGGKGEAAASLIKSSRSEIPVSLHPFNFVLYKMQSIAEG